MATAELRGELMGYWSLRERRGASGFICMSVCVATSISSYISQFTEETAFDAHAELPHMKRFLGLVGELITHPVQAMRCRRLG